jgi:hypothetical protein
MSYWLSAGLIIELLFEASAKFQFAIYSLSLNSSEFKSLDLSI